MLASDPYLSHMVAATVQTATLKDVTVGPGGARTEPSIAAAQPTATGPLIMFTLMVVLLQAVFVHLAMR